MAGARSAAFRLQILQQAQTALPNVVVGAVKVPGVPGVGDVPGGAGEVQEPADLSLGISPQTIREAIAKGEIDCEGNI